VTTWRLFPATNGPGAPTSYSGNFLAGIAFQHTSATVLWLNGYYHWVPTGGDVVARKFALWNNTVTTSGQLVPNSTVMSGTLTVNQWNFVALPTPIQITVGTPYVAATGWAAVNGFPDTNNQFGSGQPFTAGITQGPLFAFSDATGGGDVAARNPTGLAQGLFSVAGTDPSLVMPNAGSNSANFWMDVQLSDVAPAGWKGPYSLYPANLGANPATVADSAIQYVIGTEIAFSTAVQVQAIRYYAPAGTAQFATSADVWTVPGGTKVASLPSPSWSGSPGAGWTQANFAQPYPVLGAGKYKVSVYNGVVSPDEWSAKDANTNYWDTGAGTGGIVNGVLSAPSLAAASTCNLFPGPGTGPGQNVFENPAGGPNQYPDLYVSGLAQQYWVDIVVQAAPGGVLLGASPP
jgi:hypothetical protein